MALELHRRVEGHIAVQQIVPRWHEHRAPIGGGIGGLKSRSIIRHPIAHRPVVAHVDLSHHVAQENRRDIFDDDIVNPHHAAV